MTTYTSDDVRKAEEFLSANSGLAKDIENISACNDADLGSLLIAAARMDKINFMQAHTALTSLLKHRAECNGAHMPYDSAVDAAYELLDEHGVITDKRIAQFREQVIPELAKDLNVSLPEEQAKIYDFYEERARQKGVI